MEEMIHFAQYQSIYTKGGVPSIRNMEFEAKMFYDMNCRDISDECQWAKAGFTGKNETMEYLDFLYSFSENKKLTPDLLNRFHKLGEKWNDPAYQGGKYDSSFSPELIMKFFK